MPESFQNIHLADVPFVVVDVETTGRTARDGGKVTDVACITLRDSVIIDEFTSLVNPRQHIPTNIAKLTGISDAMVWNAPETAEVFRTVRQIFTQPYAVFVAHNVSFDWSFVQQSLLHSRLSPIELPQLCTYKLSKRLFPKNKRLNLGALASYLEIPIKNRHRAYGDAVATTQVLMRLLEILQDDHGATTLDDVLTFQNKRLQTFKALPRSIEKLQETLQTVPAEPGVYYFRSANDELLYIGKAKSLTSRVHSYFQVSAQHSTKIAELVRQVRDIQWTTTGTELSALLLESKEIKAHQPRYNTLIKRFRRYPFLRLGATPFGIAQNDSPEDATDIAPELAFEGVANAEALALFPRLDVCFEIADDGAEYFGPFGSRGAAEAVLETINRTFKLRKCAVMPVPSAEVVPCFYHQIERCDAPCALLQSASGYATEVETVRRFLSGERDGIVAVLRQAMLESSQNLAFEEAALRRNQMRELERVFFRQKQITGSINENNVILIVVPPVKTSTGAVSGLSSASASAKNTDDSFETISGLIATGVRSAQQEYDASQQEPMRGEYDDNDDNDDIDGNDGNDDNGGNDEQDGEQDEHSSRGTRSNNQGNNQAAAAHAVQAAWQPVSRVEVFFIRHGRLVFQRLVGKKLPVKDLRRALDKAYFDGAASSVAPKYCRKEEIDEIRIIASWVYQHRNNGRFLYTQNLSAHTLHERLCEALYDALAGKPTTEQLDAALTQTHPENRSQSRVGAHTEDNYDNRQYIPFED
jgi:DNA polymerase III subunit epsilon